MGLSSKQVSSEGLLQSSSDNSGRGSSMELPKPPIKRQQEGDVQQPPEKLKCPRCDSTNTKFCYYNNYNKSQPRHFCKACKRHWTKGGMLRNVPVGGGRKNKRLKTSPNTTKTATSANINVQASDQLRLGLQNRLEGESSMRKPLSQTILGSQSLLQDSIFNNSVELCIGKNSSSQSSFNGIFGGFSSALSIPPNHDLQFPCPSFTTLGEIYPSSVSGSAHISNLYDLNNGESNALEDSVMTGLHHTSISCSSLNDKPWPSNESTSNWGWDDIDKFVTADVTLPWDDAEIN